MAKRLKASVLYGNADLEGTRVTNALVQATLQSARARTYALCERTGRFSYLAHGAHPARVRDHADRITIRAMGD